MNKLWIIAKKDIKEAFRSRSTYIFIVVIVILSFTFFSQYGRVVNGLTNQQEIIDTSRSFLNGLAYLLPMIFSIFICSIFANYSVIVDKAKRNIESLMATPISIKQIWMGKSLAVMLPSAVIGITVSILDYLIMNFGFVMPKTGGFITLDALAIVAAIVIVPVLIFSIVAIVVYLQLVITNPRVASFVFTGIFLLLFFGTSALGNLGIAVNIALIYLGFIVVCAGIAYALSRSLTKEKVILSSKG
jgi:ABC-2 type transport system permease protein